MKKLFISYGMKKTFLLIAVYCLLFTVASAQDTVKSTEYELLAPLPGYVPTTAGKTTAGPYIEGIFKLTIAIATGLAVLALIFGGIKYMSTDALAGKSEARSTIEHAIWGLLLAISAWLILYTINPNLTNFNLKIPVQPIATVAPPSGSETCSNCVTLASLGIPTSGDAVGASIAPYFGDKLVLLNNGLRLSGIAWSVTEGYPPSVTHESTCHYIGTCVDANVSNPTATNINRFVVVASGAGLGASYEVKTTAEKQALVNAGVSPYIVVVNSQASGTHFHIR